jgi:hypothetical protein
MIDIISALMIILKIRITPVLIILAMFVFLKAIFSLLSSLAHNSYTDWMGAVDLLASLGMFIFIISDTNSFVEITSTLLLLKGIYSLVCSHGL